MLSNAYFLAKFRFDTAENEPAKILQNFRKMHFSKMHSPPSAHVEADGLLARNLHAVVLPGPARMRALCAPSSEGVVLGSVETDFCR